MEHQSITETLAQSFSTHNEPLLLATTATLRKSADFSPTPVTREQSLRSAYKRRALLRRILDVYMTNSSRIPAADIGDESVSLTDDTPTLLREAMDHLIRTNM
ncbi:hypothetical protein V1504DRAFT_435725 [Lipomyces starkeyi]